MSFQDIYYGHEAGLQPPPPPPPPLQMVVSHSMFQINTCVATLWHLADALASCRGDASVVRERIRRTRAQAIRLARNTARKLADAGDTAADGPKLAAEFETALREFQRVLQLVIAEDRRETASASAAFLRPFFSPPAPCYDTWNDHHQQRNFQIQPQQLVESRRTQDLVHLDNEQVTFNEALVLEREQEICKIQQEITEINEIFRDLITKPVHGQHEAIKIVECNLGAAATETAQAEVLLKKAAITQRTKKCSETDYMLIIALGFIVLIVVLVYSM